MLAGPGYPREKLKVGLPEAWNEPIHNERGNRMSVHKRQGASWIKSSLSFSNGNCVEVASLPDGGVGMRDSKDPDGPVLKFTPGEWHAFLGGAKGGEFDEL